MVLEKKYSIMCTEVLEILKYCPPSDINKIPKKLMEFFKLNKETNFKTSINPDIGIFNQNVRNETIIMMFIIFRNYWATESEKFEIDEILQENEIKYKKLYSVDSLFKNNTIDTQKISSVKKIEENMVKTAETSLVEYHETIITKIVNFIKKFFGRKK